MRSGKNTIYSILGIIVSLIFIGYAIYNLIHDSAFFFKGETESMNQSVMTGESIPTDTYMTLTTNSVLGNYAETKHMYGFIPLGKDEHYIVVLDDYTFISVTVKGKKTIEKLEKITDETWAAEDYRSDTSLTLVGRTHNFAGGEIFGYYKDAFTELGIDINAADSPVRYISLDATENRGSQWLFVIGSLAMGGFIIYASLASLGVIKSPASGKVSDTAGASNVESTIIDSNTELDSYVNADPFAQNKTDSATDPFARNISDSATDPFARNISDSAADPFAQNNPDSATDPFARNISDSAADPFAQNNTDNYNDPMDSFRTGYDDMMNENNNNSDGGSSTGSTSGSGLKLKL